MSEDLMQILALGAGAIVFGFVVYGLVKFFRSMDALFPDAAKHYGLAYTQDKQGSAMTNAHNVERLQGTVGGTPLRVEAHYETSGNIRRKYTWLMTNAPTGAPDGTVNVLRTAPSTKAHRVPTGDAAFDRQRFATCDVPALVPALLTAEVRAAVLRCPQADLQIAVNQGDLVVSFAGTPTSEAELRGPIDVALALGKMGG